MYRILTLAALIAQSELIFYSLWYSQPYSSMCSRVRTLSVLRVQRKLFLNLDWISFLTLALIVSFMKKHNYGSVYWAHSRQAFHNKTCFSKPHFWNTPQMLCGKTGPVVTKNLNKWLETHRLLFVVFSCWWSRWSCQYCTSGLNSTKTQLCPSGLEQDSRYITFYCFLLPGWETFLLLNMKIILISIHINDGHILCSRHIIYLGSSWSSTSSLEARK